MKILYLTNDISVLGGIEKVLLMKVSYFSKNFNYDITILNQEQMNKEYFFSETEIEKIKIKNFKSKLSKNFLFRQFQRILYFIELYKMISKEKYDILISTGNLVDMFLPFLKKKLNIKIVKEIHTTKKIKINKYSFKYLYNKLQILWLSRYDKVVILTNEDKKNWNLHNLQVIYNSLSFYSEKFPRYKSTKIISVGRLSYEKGYDILIDVWNKISKKYPEWILEIYGDGPEKEKLQDKINKLNLQKSFILKGATTNIQEKYLESSIYVMSSRFEGFGMVLIEAMACGLPIVSFDCSCGPKDIIKDNEDGYLVKFGDIEEMVEKIEMLIKDKEMRKLFGKRAKENVKRFSQDKIMPQWKELFESLLQREEK